MKGMSQYGAVATKIRGMRARLFKIEDYARLASSGSIKDLAAILKSTPSYENALTELDPENMRRARFERLLVNSVLTDIKKISYFLDAPHKELLSINSTYYELRFLNNVIREIFNKYSDPVDLSVYEAMYGNSKNFDFKKVISANTIDELISALSGSKYREPIISTSKLLDNPGLFDYETALNRFYFSNIWTEINKLKSSTDKDIILEIHGTEIDLLNINWIYRTKAYYDVPSKDISRYLIPASHKLRPRELSAMISARDSNEMMKAACATYYKRYITPGDPASLEKALNEQTAAINARQRKAYPYSFAVIESYLHDKRTEIERIIRIAESVRYGYDPRLILKGLNIGI